MSAIATPVTAPNSQPMSSLPLATPGDAMPPVPTAPGGTPAVPPSIALKERLEAQPKRDAELDAKVKALEDDIKTRQEHSLDERHLQAAEQDFLGNPVFKRGKVFSHADEVAKSRNGLERNLEELERKIIHEDRYGDPRPEESINDAEITVAKVRRFLDEIDRRLPELDKRKLKKQ